MEEQGISLPRVARRKGKRVRGCEGEKERMQKGKKGTGGEESLGSEWREIRSLMDPNPQLKGVELGKYAPKVKT